MGEKASIFQGVQIGIESVAGTGVAADKKLLACSIQPSVRTESERFRPKGNKYPAFTVLNREWVEAKLEGKPTYNELLYLLASLLGEPTPVQQGVTAGYLWEFTSNTSSEDAGLTLTVEQGDANSAWRSVGMRVSGIGLNFSSKELTLSGSAIGLALEKGVTLTADPTSLTPLPIAPGHLKFYMADTQAGLAGATAMTRGFSLDWNLTDLIGQSWPVGGAAVTVEKEPKLEAKLKLATDSVGMGLLDTMRNGATKWFRVQATGATISGTVKHLLTLDFPAQVEQPGDFGDTDGLYTVEYALAGIHDATWGKSFQISIITTVEEL